MGDPSERPSGAFTPLSPQAIIEQRLPGEGGGSMGNVALFTRGSRLCSGGRRPLPKGHLSKAAHCQGN